MPDAFKYSEAARNYMAGKIDLAEFRRLRELHQPDYAGIVQGIAWIRL